MVDMDEEEFREKQKETVNRQVIKKRYILLVVENGNLD